MSYTGKFQITPDCYPTTFPEKWTKDPRKLFIAGLGFSYSGKLFVLQKRKNPEFSITRKIIIFFYYGSDIFGAMLDIKHFLCLFTVIFWGKWIVQTQKVACWPQSSGPTRTSQKRKIKFASNGRKEGSHNNDKQVIYFPLGAQMLINKKVGESGKGGWFPSWITFVINEGCKY